MDRAIRIISLLVMQCLISIAVLTCYHAASSVHHDIVVVDFQKVMKEGLQGIAAQQISEEQQKLALKAFSLKLKKVLLELSNNGERTIIIKDVVLEGANEYTEWVLEKLQDAKSVPKND